jgi:hypothetical protein
MVALDSSSMPAEHGNKIKANQAVRGKQDMKRHVVVDRQDVPLCVTSGTVNVYDLRMMPETADALEPMRVDLLELY